MTTGDDSSVLAAALRSAGETARPREDCPDADRIWRAISLELPVRERLAVIDHTVECPACAEAWRLAAEIVPGVRDGDQRRSAIERASLPSHAAWFTPLREHRATLGAAAMLVLIVGAFAFFQTFRQSGGPVSRDPGAIVLRSAVPGGALPRGDFRLRWAGGPAGARYDLTVTTSRLEVVIDVRGLEQPEYTIAPARLAGLPAGTRLLWRVIAHAPDGLTASSGTLETLLE
jgi:hypothetical protein